MNRTKKIAALIEVMERGTVFTPSDFLHLGSPHAVGMALGRMTKAGKIRRIGRGLYDLPRTHPVLGVLEPSADAVTEAVARRDGISIEPTDATAANLLGLSEQVPSQVVYATNGPTRKIRLTSGNAIHLHHRSPRKTARARRSSALVFAALRSIGKENLDEARVRHLQKALPARERRELLEDLRLAPAWMHPCLRYIAGSENKE